MQKEKIFFGREEQLLLLKKRVLNLKEGYRQNVALLGSRFVGKSTLLYEFFNNLDDKQVTVIYLDVENKDLDYFFLKFVGSLLYNYSKNTALPLYDDLNLLLENTKRYIPQTERLIKKIRVNLSKGKQSDVVLDLLKLPEVFTKESGQYCVLILDEFQNLEDFQVPNVFQELGQKIMTQKNCFYIVSSSYKSLAQKILSEKLSLLFGNFEIVNVEPFDNNCGNEFIENNLQDYKMGDVFRNFLANFTGGHPLYLNLICRELINLSAIHKQSEIYFPLLSQAIENTLFDQWGAISRHFEIVINELVSGKGHRVNAHILIAMANGQTKVNDLVDIVGIKKNQISLRMNRLLEMGYITKNGTYHYIKDKLLKYWVKYVYQKRLKDVELAPDRRSKQFREEFQQIFEEYKQCSQQKFSSRIMELLYCFDNESFHLNGRKYKLPQFREIGVVDRVKENRHSFDMLEAQTRDGVWCFIAKKEQMCENDMSAIVSDYKKTGKKLERCVLISLKNLDENAKLKALEERFWVWNEGELNTLLTLFDKPYI